MDVPQRLNPHSFRGFHGRPERPSSGVSTFFRVAASLRNTQHPCSVTGHSFSCAAGMQSMSGLYNSPCWLSFCQIGEAIGKLFRRVCQSGLHGEIWEPGVCTARRYHHADSAARYLLRTSADAAVACLHSDSDAHAGPGHRSNHCHLLPHLLGHAQVAAGSGSVEPLPHWRRTDCCVQGGPQDDWGMFSYPFYLRLKADGPGVRADGCFSGCRRRSSACAAGKATRMAKPLRGEFVSGNYFSALLVFEPSPDAPSLPATTKPPRRR